MKPDVMIGIDPCLTSTGVCYGTGPNDWNSFAVKSTSRGDDVLSRIRRCEFITEQLEKIIATLRPRLILIEDYAFGSRQGKPAYRAELGGILRWHFIDYTNHILEVAPGTLKKFATGSGKGDKSQIQAHIQKRWKQMFETDDEADAFVLFQMALCISGRQQPATQPQREAVAKVLSGHPATGPQIIEFCNAVEKDSSG